MPRKPRYFLQGIPAHIVQRGNNRQAVFFEQADYATYLSLLSKAKERYSCIIHSYALMTNHVHVLATPETRESISQMMQYVGRQYVPYVNQKYQRTGTLWEGRFKATIVESAEYLLACYRYIEMNPVRAGIVEHPAEYRWSSYGKNALLKGNPLVNEHSGYLALGSTAEQRASKYRSLFELEVSDAELANIRSHTLSGTPLGNDKFRTQIETALETSTGKVKRGRPKKRVTDRKGL